MSFVCIQFKYQTVVFTIVGPYIVLPLWDQVELGEMAMKGYSAFPNVLSSLELHQPIV